MIDLLYILGTVAFFALMLAYIQGILRLGGDETDEDHRK